MDMTEADAVSPTAAVTPAPAAQELTAQDACHPHLFARTRAIVRATNGGIWRLLRPLHDVMRFPRHRDGTSGTWERVVDGVDWLYTMTKTGDHSFTASLQAKKANDATATFVTIYSAQVDRDPADQDGSGSASMDFDALATFTGEDDGGKVSLSFTLSPAAKTVIYTMAGFHHDGEAPRDGKYVFHKEPGKGGSLKFRHDFALACTGPGGATTGLTPVSVVARWIAVSNGTHFRSDALATGGQIAAGEKWEGVTCAANTRTVDEPAETYWMMKLEDATSATVSGFAHASPNGSAACDAAFGPVPAVDSAANDYDFTKIDFTSDDVVPFP
jgi:hypothetical protein